MRKDVRRRIGLGSTRPGGGWLEPLFAWMDWAEDHPVWAVLMAAWTLCGAVGAAGIGIAIAS